MLTDLSIRNIAVIEEASLGLLDDLTVMTGETGAGKSIAVDALALALGARASFEVVRTGADQGEVTARFELPPESPAITWLEGRELSAGPECVLRRIVDRKGSRGFVNGHPVPVQLLRELGELLVEIHGQHEHQLLLRTPVQRDLLDAYAGAAAEAAELAAVVQELERTRAHLENLTHDLALRSARRELLAHELQELDRLGLTPAEIAELEHAHRRAAHAQEVAHSLQEVRERLEEDGGALPQLLRSSHTLQALAAIDPLLASAAERLQSWAVDLQDLLRELRRLESEPTDAAELAQMERQIAEVERLARKHHVPAGQLAQVHAQLTAEMESLAAQEAGSANLEQRIQTLAERARALAAGLSGARAAAAARLGTEVTRRLPGLGMAEAEVQVVLTPLERVTAHGQEEVAFHVRTNPGHPLRPLARVASGGELSRLSLALQVVLAEIASVPTLIFDEVDVGIGGAVAEIVGRELRALAARRQVLCITHLPQVAAHGRHHYRVQKRRRRDSIVTMIETLTGDARTSEVARMLGGAEETPESLALASDLLRRGTR
ncbi:MAG TPA: DNA repair protein RecN [Acidiferrobacteraceae bacterium]|nr:DNA repair protein RecN [Acidiferrobacteraceae bacterium]